MMRVMNNMARSTSTVLRTQCQANQRTDRTRLNPLLILTLVFALVGCGTYDARYAYEPGPAEIALMDQRPDGEHRGRALATIIGVRRDNPALEFPNTVEVRVRVENDSEKSVSFDPSSLQLLAADLTPFGQPTTRPAEQVTLEPGQTATVRAFFPVPRDAYRDDVNMQGLNLKWQMQVGQKTVQPSFTFNRKEYRYHDRHDYTGRYRYGHGLWYYH